MNWNNATVLFDFDNLLMREAEGSLNPELRKRLDGHKANYFKHNKKGRNENL